MSVWAWVAFGLAAWVAAACLIVLFMSIGARVPEPPMLTEAELEAELERWRRELDNYYGRPAE